ncbi:MAG: hypothetical protein LJE97_19555 [Betaproteobacteria bacterium]|jgi:Tfp pilus assembly protein PilP|nr:hypothetical protein [Betaproteobacteria bacterium]
MRLTPIQRWAILGTALALTLVAVRWASSDDDIEVKTPRPPRTAAEQAPEPLPRVALDRLNRLAHAAPAADPFAPRSWQASQDEARKNAPPPPPPAAPRAPPLPFKYLGKAIEGGKVTAFLSRGDNTYVVRPGDTLDGAYRVESLDDQVIVFKYLPLGQRQELALGKTE